MKEKKAVLILVLLFVLLLGAAGILYSRLSEKAAPRAPQENLQRFPHKTYGSSLYGNLLKHNNKVSV